MHLFDILLLLLGPGRCSSTKPLVYDRIGPFAKEFNFARWRSYNHRHALPVAAELQDVQQFKAVLNPFERNLDEGIKHH